MVAFFTWLGYTKMASCVKSWREMGWLYALAFPDEVDHLIYLFLLVVEVQRLHATLEIGRSEAFCPKSLDRPRVIVLYRS